MNVNNFELVNSIHGRIIVPRHCDHIIEWIAKTGAPHIQAEIAVIVAICATLPDDCVCVDAGANVGLVAIPMAQAVAAKRGVVHAYEPQRLLYQALCGSAVLNDLENLYPVHAGLGAEQTSFVIPPVDYARRGDYGQVRLAVADATDPVASHVPVWPLDLRCAQLDFLKIDVEGMEVDVLRGAQVLIRRCKPWIWAEHWIAGIDPIKAELGRQDYRFFRMNDLDMLCVPNSRAADSGLDMSHRIEIRDWRV